MIASLVAAIARLIAGAQVRWLGPPPVVGAPAIYFANHTSHLDALVIWAALPPALRARTRPVAARDYWDATKLRRFLAERAFRAVLIERREVRRGSNPLEPMLAALAQGDSLILFPEGTRGDGETIGPFKSGLHHLARHRPDVVLIPVHVDNLNRILPKGEYLAIPLLSCLSFGPPLPFDPAEARDAFLRRAEESVRSLRRP